MHHQLGKTFSAISRWASAEITYSVVAAEMIRDAILGRENPDARLFRFDG